jgi:hypothetical protein
MAPTNPAQATDIDTDSPAVFSSQTSATIVNTT